MMLCTASTFHTPNFNFFLVLHRFISTLASPQHEIYMYVSDSNTKLYTPANCLKFSCSIRFQQMMTWTP